MAQKELSQKALLSLILIEGVCSIGIEVLALRQLTSFVGTSIPVTSTIIGMFLLFLSVGYYYGGQVKSSYKDDMIRNFIVSGMWVLVFLSYPITSLFFELMSFNMMVELFIYLVVSLGVPVMLIGKTVPIITNLLQVTQIGEASGKALFISTIGSFIGSIGLSVFAMRYLGVSVCVILISALLLLSAFYVSIYVNFNKYKIIKIVGFFIFFVVLSSILVPPHITTQNAYGNYGVVYGDKGNKSNIDKVFIINQQSASGLFFDGKPFKYIEYIHNILKSRGDEKLNNLILGAGGFSLAMYEDSSRYVFVDIDPDILEVVNNTKFNTKNDMIFKSEDAQVFLRNTTEFFPNIVVDTFSSSIGIPSHVATREFHQSVYDRLKMGGSVYYNLILDNKLADPMSKNVITTIQSVFGICAINILDYKTESGMSNVIVICNKMSDANGVIYTSDKNSFSFDLFDRIFRNSFKK